MDRSSVIAGTKRVFIFVLVFLCAVGLWAETGENGDKENFEEKAGGEEKLTPAYEDFPQALGFQGGFLSGTGLTYQVWKGRHGFQATLGALYFPPDQREFYANTTLDYNFGFEYQYRVYGEAFDEKVTGQLYLFTGLGHRGFIPVETTYDEETGDATHSIGVYTPQVLTGLGLGIEVVVLEHFSFPLEVGYIGTVTPTKGDPAEMFLLELRPQGGFRYRY